MLKFKLKNKKLIFFKLEKRRIAKRLNLSEDFVNEAEKEYKVMENHY